MDNLTLYRSEEVKRIKENTLDGIIVENSFAIDGDLKVAYFVSGCNLYSLNLHNKEVKLLLAELDD